MWMDEYVVVHRIPFPFRGDLSVSAKHDLLILVIIVNVSIGVDLALSLFWWLQSQFFWRKKFHVKKRDGISIWGYLACVKYHCFTLLSF
jgi:hypothetical protein